MRIPAQRQKCRTQLEPAGLRRAAVWAVVVLAGCSDAPITERGDETAADTVYAAVVSTIGVVDGDTLYQFGDVTSIAADDSGRIYVADRIASNVRVYSADGRYLALVGGKGSGPGEFEWPADLTLDSHGRLWVRDAARITMFAPGSGAAVADSVVRTWTIPFFANLGARRGRVDAAGRYLYPVDIGRDTLPHFYLPVDETGFLADTIEVPPYGGFTRTRAAFVRTSPGGGRIVDGFAAAPFSAVPAWDVTQRGTVISGSGETYELVETNSTGDTVAIIRGPVRERPVPAQEQRDSARALEARIDSLPVPLDQVVNLAPEIRDGTWPRVLPAFMGVHVGSDGRVWVEQWPAENGADERLYHVFDDGRLRHVVVLPVPLAPDTPPWFGGSMVYGVVRDAETDVERVVALRLNSR